MSARSELLDDAVGYARAVMARAKAVDLDNTPVLAASQAELAVNLQRILWILDHEDPQFRDVAAEVDMEDGVTRPVFVKTRRAVAA